MFYDLLPKIRHQDTTHRLSWVRTRAEARRTARSCGLSIGDESDYDGMLGLLSCGAW